MPTSTKFALARRALCHVCWKMVQLVKLRSFYVVAPLLLLLCGQCPLIFIAVPLVAAQQQQSTGLTSCPAPIFGKFGGSFRTAGSTCSCSYGFGILRLSCNHVGRNMLQAMLNAINQTHVESLKIDNSDIGQLPILDGMRRRLKYFRCKNCNLDGAHLPCNTFKGFSELRTINLSDNPLEKLCSTFFTNLFRKPKNNAAIPDFPAIGAPGGEPKKPGVKINLSNTRLSEIPLNMFKGDGLEQVVALDLSGNKLAYPLESGVFSKMTGLEELGMSAMGLIDFQDNWFISSDDATTDAPSPDGFRQRDQEDVNTTNPPRRQAVIGSPKISPEEARLATAKLKKLDLSHNSIRHIRTKDINLFESSLQALDLSHNQLQTLPTFFLSDFAELSDVSLAHNELKVIRENLFLKSSKLHALSFAHNRPLLALPLRLFSTSPALKRLSLAFLPKLTRLNEEMFIPFTSEDDHEAAISLDLIDLRGTRLFNTPAILQLTQALQGVVEIKIVLDTD